MDAEDGLRGNDALERFTYLLLHARGVRSHGQTEQGMPLRDSGVTGRRLEVRRGGPCLRDA